MSKTKWPTNLKRTKMRQLIVNLLKETKEPVSAFELQQNLIKDNYDVWPSTLYRSLDALEKAGIVTKFTLTNSPTALYKLKTEEHTHYAICLSCQKMFPVLNCPLENFNPEISNEKFLVLSHKMELYGYCQKCLKKHEQKV